MCDVAINSPVLYHQENVDELLQPKIVTPLPLQTSHKLGTEVKLLCLLTGYPPLEIKWFLNGELIKPSDDGRISFENQMRMLVIKDVKLQDSGAITFEARNKYGEVASNCYLEVVAPPSKRKDSKGNCHSPKAMRKLMHAMRKMKSF